MAATGESSLCQWWTASAVKVSVSRNEGPEINKLNTNKLSMKDRQ
jgi:hypothetical protein